MVEVQVGLDLGGRRERVELVLEHGGGQVEVHGSLPRRAAAGGAAPVGHDDREPLVGEPLRRRERTPRLEHALRVRPAVGIEQDGEGVAGHVVLGQEDRGGDAAVAEVVDRHARPHERGGGERIEGAHRRGGWAIAGRPGGIGGRWGEDRDGGAVVVQPDGADDERVAAGDRRVHPLALGDRLEPARGPSPHERSRGVVHRVRREEELVGADVHDRSHLQTGGRHHLVVDEQPAGAPAVRAHDEPTVPEAGRRAGGPLDPRIVVVGEARCRPAGDGIDGPHVDGPLVARVQREERTVVVPPRRGEVGPRLPVPRHLDAGAVQPHDPGGDRGVRGAGRGVGDLGRGDLRSRRIGDPPAGHRRVIDARRRAARLPSGAHQNPRARSISSAAMNSATPQRTSRSSSVASTRAVAASSSSATQSDRPSTQATRRPAGSGRGSITGPGTGWSRPVPRARSATTSCPARAPTATVCVASVA